MQIISREVVWRKEDGTLIESGSESGGQHGALHLTSVRSSIAGGYTCEVRAESGELARRTVRIDIHSKYY